MCYTVAVALTIVVVVASQRHGLASHLIQEKIMFLVEIIGIIAGAVGLDSINKCFSPL